MGIYLITIFIFFLAITISLELSLLLLDQYVDSYYVLIGFVFLIPLYVGCLLYFCYARTKSYKDRGYLITGVVLAMVSVFLYEVYSIAYFRDKYEYYEVKLGVGNKDDPNNYKTSIRKESFIARYIVELLVYEGLLIYFLVVTCRWRDLTNRK